MMGLEVTALWIRAAADVASGTRKAGDALRDVCDAAMMQTGTSAPPPGAPAAWLAFRRAVWPRSRPPAALAAMDGVAAEVDRIAGQVGKAGKAAAAGGAGSPFKTAMGAAVKAGAARLDKADYAAFSAAMGDSKVSPATLKAAAAESGVRLPREVYAALVGR